MSNVNKTVLITGANSGIGLEAAALFAEAGYTKVILGCRSATKASAARKQLVERVGKDVFDELVVDVAEIDSAKAATAALIERHDQLDVLVLNAAMSNGNSPIFNKDGIEMTFASTLLGHHVMTMELLNQGKLAPDANIIIAGSEGARGDVPMMNVPDFNEMAKQVGGDLEALHEAIWRIQSPYQYDGMSTYVTGKVYVAWWASALASRVPAGITVNAVSPGSVPDTNFARHQGLLMKIMIPIMKVLPKSMGMAWSLADGAGRYVEAAQFSTEVNGAFYASAPGKMVGPQEIQTLPHFLDEKNQEASWQMLTRISGVSLN